MSTPLGHLMGADVRDLFECSPVEMIFKCSQFAESTRNMDVHHKKAAYLAFFMRSMGANDL